MVSSFLSISCLLLFLLWVRVATGFSRFTFLPTSQRSRTITTKLAVEGTNSNSPLSPFHRDESTTSGRQQGFLTQPPGWLLQAFHSVSSCDDINLPPSLHNMLRNLQLLTYSSADIRGIYQPNPSSTSSVALAETSTSQSSTGGLPVLTPFAAYCFGYALAQQLMNMYSSSPTSMDKRLVIALGRDPRGSGYRLADAWSRGALAASNEEWTIETVFAGITTTPGCASFCQLPVLENGMPCHASVMVTASHLPSDRNGFKIFLRMPTESMVTGITKEQLRELGGLAVSFASDYMSSQALMPPSSGDQAVFCTKLVEDTFPQAYAKSLQDSIRQEVSEHVADPALPLKGLKIVMNAGNGSGGFFAKALQELGADMTGSIGVEPDGTFPAGFVPNPEYKPMIQQTIEACQQAHADLGILLDTDGDRCGFVVPSNDGGEVKYAPLNRNRLIALMGVILSNSNPGCAVVTDSVTSEGLSFFLEDNLKLKHVRYIKGYANVIRKAKEIAGAELAIETSGHCAMKENSYMDDGTYTAVKVVSLLAKQKAQQKDGASLSLLDLIAEMKELEEVTELRMSVKDGSLDTMQLVFDQCSASIEDLCNGPQEGDNAWKLDTDNLEGIRVRVGTEGSFFLLRKSLHDPLISLQVEGHGTEHARSAIVQPIYQALAQKSSIADQLELTVLNDY